MKDFNQSDAYRITWLIRRLFRAMGDKANSYLADLGVSAAERAVMEFLHPDKRLTVPEIARRYNVSRQHVQVTVNQLIERKLLSIDDNPQHKRSQLISLSSKGHRLFSNIAARDRKAIESLFADVSASEQARTRRTLERLFNVLNQDGEKS